MPIFTLANSIVCVLCGHWAHHWDECGFAVVVFTQSALIAATTTTLSLSNPTRLDAAAAGAALVCLCARDCAAKKRKYCTVQY